MKDLVFMIIGGNGRSDGGAGGADGGSDGAGIGRNSFETRRDDSEGTR